MESAEINLWSLNPGPNLGPVLGLVKCARPTLYNLADRMARWQDGRTIMVGNMNHVICPIETTQ